jgi:hypothetical protein
MGGALAAPLKQDDRLATAAPAHSQDMAANDLFDHLGSDGSKLGDRIASQGCRWTFYAENVGCGLYVACRGGSGVDEQRGPSRQCAERRRRYALCYLLDGGFCHRRLTVARTKQNLVEHQNLS